MTIKSQNNCTVKLLAVAAFLAGGLLVAQAQVGSGWTQYFPTKQYNSALPQSQRYSVSGNVEHFWIYSTDPSEFPGHDSGPRSEWRVNNNYTTGTQQFQADLNPENGTSSYTCFQIFGATSQATSIQLQMRSNNGTLKRYDSEVLATGCWGIYTRVNVIHDTSAGQIEVWINGSHIGTYPDGGDINHYFKYGVYATPSVTSYAGDYWRGASFFSGGSSGDFSLSASPGSLTVTQGNSGASSITVNPLNGFNGSVSLSASGLPGGVTASFNPSSTTGSSTLTLTASSTAATGTATVTVTGTSGSLTHTTTVSLTVNAAPNLSGIFQLQNEASGLVLNNQGSLTNGSAITQWSSLASSNLDWTFIATSNGYYQINSCKSGRDAVVQGASTANGAGIIQWSFGAAGNDQWKPVQNSDGSYTFFNLHSGLVLEDPASSTNKTTQMDQWASNSGSNQKWKLLKQ